MEYGERIWKCVEAVRARRPLVLSVTNNVVTNVTANALLALGASPAMTHAAQDAAELAAVAGAVVLNMGTPQQAYVDSMEAAGVAANGKDVPVVFDPVAVGATAYRAQVGRVILDRVRVSVVRGNASEILALAGSQARGQGVDSGDDAGSAVDAARALAGRLQCVVCVSGEEDFVTDGAKVIGVAGGVAMMTRVTGMGCTATALVGALAAVAADMMEATVAGMAVMSLAGEIADSGGPGPGTFAVRFLDALYSLAESDIEAGLKVREL